MGNVSEIVELLVTSSNKQVHTFGVTIDESATMYGMTTDSAYN